MSKTKEKLYYVIPLGVLREIIKQNAEKPNEYIQLFELTQDRIFSKTELEQHGNIEERGLIITGGENAD